MGLDYESVLCAAPLRELRALYPKIENFTALINKTSFAENSLLKSLIIDHQSAVDDRPKALLSLLMEAGDFSPKAANPRAAMVSVFTDIDIGRGMHNGAEFNYRLSSFLDKSHFPEKLGLNHMHAEAEFSAHLHNFETEFIELFAKPYSGMVDTLIHLMQKYFWCIPGDYGSSLADLAKVNCAFSACLYKYHEANSLSEATIVDDSSDKLIMVCGDISGIQGYIYGTASIGQGGVAKRLRGRSFRISLLTEAIAIRILSALDLPLACKIMAAGGQFYLLIPNTADALEKLNQTVQSITDWLLGKYCGEIGISMASRELTSQELLSGQIDNALRNIRSRMAKAKLRKYESVLSHGPVVFDINFHDRVACPICDRHPAEQGENEDVQCSECKADVLLGQNLISCDWLVFSKQAMEGAVELFDQPKWYVSLVKETTDALKYEPIMIYNLHSAEMIDGSPSGFILHAGYVPRWENWEEIEAASEEHSDIGDKDTYFNSRDLVNSGLAVKSFSALAASSVGVGLIGVLRADVDYLGFIFAQGMKGHKSLSRIATVSKMLNVFFTYELSKLLENEFQNTYTAYSGGDDLMLIGPWEKMLDLSKRISDEFKRFAAGNPNISISAGIGTYKPKAPIAITSVQTGEILEKSKAAGRDRFSVFETTMQWKEFGDMKRWAGKLSEEILTGKLSSAFLYRLLEYQRRAESFYSNSGDARSALYKAHLAYDIGRNLVDENGQPIIDKELHEMLVSLVKADANIWRILKAPIAWASYAVRKER